MTVRKYNWGDDTDASVDITHIGGHAVDTNIGAAGDGTLRVTVATDDAVPVSLAAIEASLDIVDDWDENDRAKINPIVGQAGITAGAGVVAANTPRVTHASDDPAVVALQIMDDWDETNRCAVNPIVGQAGVAAGAGVVGVTVPRTTLANDDPAVVALQIIDDWDETNRCAVNLIAGQIGVAAAAGATDALTQRVVLATDDLVAACQDTDDAAAGSVGLSVTAKAKTAQRAAVADNDAVQPIANEYGELVLSGHTWATRSIRCEEIDPIDQKYVGETVVNAQTGAASTYSYYLDMGGYTKLGIQLQATVVTSVTMTIWGTLQDDSTAPGSITTYQDITNAVFGVASYTATGMALSTTGACGLMKYIKIQVITGAAGDSFTIYAKRSY